MYTSSLTLPSQLIEAPVSDSNRSYETLGYIEAHDAILNSPYAFVAYRETKRSSGVYRVKVIGKGTAGAFFDPVAIRSRCSEASANGEAYFTWGNSFTPSRIDPRQIEFRVHQQAGAPQALEILVVTRQADGTPAAPQSVRIENFMSKAAPARNSLQQN